LKRGGAESPLSPLSKGGAEGGGINYPQRGPCYFDAEILKKRGLVFNGRHLPYNPKLVERARQLRKNMTPAERKLWFGYLRTFPHRVLRQRPIDNFIADFYCPTISLVVEIDGGGHYTDEGMAYDEERSDILKSYGLWVIRFSNRDVLDNLAGVCWQINEYLLAHPTGTKPDVQPEHGQVD